MGAYANCKWCDGRGCLGCDGERKKDQEAGVVPGLLFEADRSNPRDMELLRRFFGVEALEHAFGPEGGGMGEIEHNAAVASLLQAARKVEPEDKE